MAVSARVHKDDKTMTTSVQTENFVVRAVKVNIAVLVTPEKEIRLTKRIADQFPILWRTRQEMGYNGEELHPVIGKVTGRALDKTNRQPWMLLCETPNGLAWETPFLPDPQHGIRGDKLEDIPHIIL
jgi:hypothetical protein